MNSIVKLQLFFILSIFIYEVKSERLCCPNNSTFSYSKRCRDDGNSKINISCDSYLTVLNTEWGFTDQFVIHQDEQGEYLEAFIMGFSVREPYYCTGLMKSLFSSNVTKSAVICSSSRLWYHEQNLTGHAEAKQEVQVLKIYGIIALILNILSGLALLTTAGIYFFLPVVQDLQGACYFHCTLIAGLCHTAAAYKKLFDMKSLIPDMCITNTYLNMYMALSAFAWASVISFNTWRQTRNINTNDERKLLVIYKLFAYGVPTILLFLAWTHVHIENMADMTFELSCYEHQMKVYEIYGVFPILLSLLMNLLMFLDCQIKIWNLHTVRLGERKLMAKIIKYRIFLNAKLLVIMGIPWSLLLLLLIVEDIVQHVVLTNVIFFLRILVVSEGIPIFLVLVVFRKRVLRGVATRLPDTMNIFPDKWRTVHDSETEEENEDDHDKRGEGGQTNFEVRFNNINNTNTTNHNYSSPIVMI